jgi:short-subunit dehydrogenase
MRMRTNILITGASSGLGAGLAREFAARGRNLALCARRVERLDALRAELMAAHPGIRVAVRALDVDDHDQVFAVFRSVRDELGTLDRVIVNAGMGRGAAIGTGYFIANRQTAMTNFVSALAQCEAAMEIFRAQGHGHLVAIASMAALRGMPRAQTTYAASKAALASLAEGMRMDAMGTPIRISTIYPGYIDTPINEKVKHRPFVVDAVTGCRLLAVAIEKEKDKAYVPAWPWSVLGFFMKHMPLAVVRRMV